MVDKIVYTYKFTTLPNVDFLKDECKIWLTTILDKFDPEKGSKAFSYFSVITKNWFIHKVKKNAKELKQEINYESAVGEINLLKKVGTKEHNGESRLRRVLAGRSREHIE